MSIKHPSVSPAFGENKKKAITLEIKLKIIAQLETYVCVLSSKL